MQHSVYDNNPTAALLVRGQLPLRLVIRDPTRLKESHQSYILTNLDWPCFRVVWSRASSPSSRSFSCVMLYTSFGRATTRSERWRLGASTLASHRSDCDGDRYTYLRSWPHNEILIRPTVTSAQKEMHTGYWCPHRPRLWLQLMTIREETQDDVPNLKPFRMKYTGRM